MKFVSSAYRVHEKQGFLEPTLILDKPAKSNLEVSVIGIENNAKGELFTVYDWAYNNQPCECKLH